MLDAQWGSWDEGNARYKEEQCMIQERGKAHPNRWKRGHWQACFEC